MKQNKWFGKCLICKRDEQKLMTVIITFDNGFRYTLKRSCEVCRIMIHDNIINSFEQLEKEK